MKQAMDASSDAMEGFCRNVFQINLMKQIAVENRICFYGSFNVEQEIKLFDCRYTIGQSATVRLF
jgi:hypothetical protein